MVRLATNVTDPVADLLTRIRNANLAAKDELFVPASRLNEAICGILKREGYIRSVKKETDDQFPVLRLELKYGKNRERTITGLKRISTPGRRVYTGRDKLPRVLGGLGIAILSTSRGVMTDREASKQKLGGEVLAHVW
jgi:small subunit ribosomal protein S8